MPWLVELVRTLPDLARSYLPGAPIDARSREQVILAVTEVNGCRYCAWIHGSWSDYLGQVEDPAEVIDVLLAHARACGRGGGAARHRSAAGGAACRRRRPVCGRPSPRSRWPTWSATPSTASLARLRRSARSTRPRRSGSWPPSPWPSRSRCPCWPWAARSWLLRSRRPELPVVAIAPGRRRPTCSRTSSPGRCRPTWPTPASACAALRLARADRARHHRPGRTSATIRIGRGWRAHRQRHRPRRRAGRGGRRGAAAAAGHGPPRAGDRLARVKRPR